MADVSKCSEKSICLSIPFSSANSAALARDVLGVDKELKGSKIRREITTSDSNLLINFYGNDLKILRVSVNSVLKNVLLIVKTMDQFN